MKTTIRFAALAIGAAAGTAAAQSTVMIDNFSDAYQSEEFFTGAIPQPGDTIPQDQAYYNRAGLEVGGNLYLSQGRDPGETAPPRVSRAVEQQTQTGLSGVLGGRRDATLEAGDPNNMGSDVSVANSHWQGTGNVMSFSTAFGTQGRLDLVYGQTSSLNADLSGFDQGALGLELVSGDLNYDNDDYDRPVPATVTLWSDVGGDEAQASSTVSLLEESVHEWSFGDFSGIDFSDVDRIQLTLDQTGEGLAAVDFGVKGFAAGETGNVPTPGSAALLGLGGLVAARRRR